MKVFFSDRAFTGILAETTERMMTETGGLFLGTVFQGQWYVIETIDPGPKSTFQEAYFEYDKEYSQHLINKIANLYEAPLEPIGLWHRHPGSFDQFSSTDDETNSKYAGMRQEGAISALVNIDPSFRLTVYHVGQPCSYTVMEYAVGDYLIPDELLRYKTSQNFEEMMRESLKNDTDKTRGENYLRKIRFYDFIKCICPALRKYPSDIPEPVKGEDETAAERILDEIFEDITYMTDICGMVFSMVRKNSCIYINSEKDQGKPTELCFRYIKDSDKVILTYGKQNYLYTRNSFKKAFENRKKNLLSNSNTIYRNSLLIAETVKKIVKIARNGEEE